MLRRRMMMAQGEVSLPDGYTALEYLESDGTQYIDTGFKPNQDTRLVMDVHLLSTTTGKGYPMAFGVYTDDSNRFVSYWNADTWHVWFGNYASGISSPNIERVKIDLSKDQYIVGDVSLPVSSASFTSNRTLCLSAMNEGNINYVSQARLYSCRIYDNGTLVRDFIPAMNASGEAGLYDLKNDVWYALLPAVKPKVENKISIKETDWYWDEIYNQTIGDYILIKRCTGVVTSTYPVATKITGYFMADYNTNFIFSLPVNRSEIEINYLRSGGIDASSALLIRSISPTEDDTYIYTF